MNLGDFALAVMLGLSLLGMVVGFVVFGSLGLIAGIRYALKHWFAS